MATQLVAFFAMGLYRGLWRAFVAADIVIIVEGVVIGMLATHVFLFVYYGYAPISWMVVVIQAVIVTAGVIASRLISRQFPPALRSRLSPALRRSAAAPRPPPTPQTRTSAAAP